VETSALKRINVDECFFDLVREMRRNERVMCGIGPGRSRPKRLSSKGCSIF